MSTTSLLSLDQRLLETLGFWRYRHAVTTALAASTSVVSTNLQQHRSTADSFNDWWIYIEDEENAGESRMVNDDDGTSTLTVLGGNFTDDGATLAKFRLCPFSWLNRSTAIIRACKEIYPDVHIPIDNSDLVMGNILPPFRWATSSTLDIYTEPTGTLAQTTDTAYLWRGSSSAKITASGADDYLYIDSTDYPELLDLEGKSINYYCRVYPEVANDAFLTVAWTESDGDTDSEDSTTTCPAGQHTLIKIEDLSIPEDIVQIQFRMRVHTDTKYVYFDQPIATGLDINEYLLPSEFDYGNVARVYLQTTGHSDEPFDDIHPKYSLPVGDIEVIKRNVNTTLYKFLRIPLYSSKYRINIIGDKPLETLASATSSGTVTVDDYTQLDLIAELAAYHMYKMEREGIAVGDRAHLDQQAAYHYGEYLRLLSEHGMQRPKVKMRIPTIY